MPCSIVAKVSAKKWDKQLGNCYAFFTEEEQFAKDKYYYEAMQDKAPLDMLK